MREDRHSNTPRVAQNYSYCSFTPQEDKLGATPIIEGDRFINFRNDDEDIS